MTEASKTPRGEPSKAERLAAALRENLKRRKAQARAQHDIRRGAAKEVAKDKYPLK